MAHVDIIGPEDADGLLERIYRQRIAGAGRLWNIVSVQCHNPESLRESMRLYGAVMFGESPLTRAQREMIAVATRSPAAVGTAEIETLRRLGWSDRAITDAAQVCAYFNYINRIAEGLGVDPEDWLDESGRPR